MLALHSARGSAPAFTRLTHTDEGPQIALHGETVALPGVPPATRHSPSSEPSLSLAVFRLWRRSLRADHVRRHMQLEATNVLTAGGVRRTTQEGGKVPDVSSVTLLRFLLKRRAVMSSVMRWRDGLVHGRRADVALANASARIPPRREPERAVSAHLHSAIVVEEGTPILSCDFLSQSTSGAPRTNS